MKDLGCIGNLPLARFDGPSADLVERLRLTEEMNYLRPSLSGYGRGFAAGVRSHLRS
jgi:hypothetical protein